MTEYSLTSNAKKGGRKPPFFVWVSGLSVCLMIALFGAVSHANAEAPTRSSPGDYQLAAGDVIRIQVRDEKDLSLDIKIDQKGFFSYPFLGEIQAAGLSVDQLEDRIEEGLRGDYLVSPHVLVYIQEYRPFYVNGQVARPGGYPYVPGLTVEKAVTLAGGLTERASRRRIFLLREADPQQSRQSVEMSSTIGPGDTVVVEESFF